MAWAAAVPSIVGAVGGLAATLATNSANSSMNRDTRQWQTEMSNTEVQRRVADLKAAGLNPMLAYGGQASVPGATQIPMENPAESISKLTSSAMEAYMKRSQKTALELGNANLAAQHDEIKASTAQKASEALEAQSRTDLNQLVGQNLVADTELKGTTSTNLKRSYDVLNAEYARLTEEAKNIATRTQGEALDNQQKVDLYPLIKQMQQLENRRVQLGLPRLENEAAVQDSWFMRKLSPYLPDILKSTGAAAAAGTAFKAFK